VRPSASREICSELHLSLHAALTTPFTSGGSRNLEWGRRHPLPSPELPFPLFPPLPFLLSFLFSSLPSLPLELGPLKSSYRVWGSAISSPSGVWAKPQL